MLVVAVLVIRETIMRRVNHSRSLGLIATVGLLRRLAFTGLLLQVCVMVPMQRTNHLFAGDASEARSKATTLLTAYRENAEKILSGVFSAAGVNEMHGHGKSVRWKVQVSSAFDYPNGKFRFDRVQPYREARSRDPVRTSSS